MASKPARKDGVGYTRLVLNDRGHFSEEVTVETFALEGNSAAVRRINRRVTLSGPNDDDGWLSCITSGWNSGPNGYWSETFKPRMFTRRWLTVSYELGYYCGGAHPEYSTASRTFDRQTGEDVDLYEWLNGRAGERVSSGSRGEFATKLRAPFRKIVLRSKAQEAECHDVLSNADYWDVELTRNGFAFTPELTHAEGRCSDEFPVSFATLAPYLSAEGKKNVAELQAEFARSANPR
jgi:hypothetical protein